VSSVAIHLAATLSFDSATSDLRPTRVSDRPPPVTVFPDLCDLRLMVIIWITYS
jgi:hypothetical protein